MRRTLVVTALALSAVIAVALANQLAARQREYRELVMNGDESLRQDDTAGALEAYSGAIALRGDSMLAFLRRGEVYRRTGDLDRAVHDLHVAVSLDSTNPRPIEELGDVLYQLQRYDAAIKNYEALLRLDDRSARATYKLGLAQYRMGALEAALVSLRQAIALDDRMADAHYLLGLCLRDQHRSLEALKAFDRAVQASPAHIAAREELADLLGIVDRRADQIEQLQLLAGLDRNRPSRQAALGLAYARAKKWDAAVLTLGSALERTRDPLLYQALGHVWLDSARSRGDRVELRKAREALEPIASIAGASSETLLLAGQAALEDGDVDAAERRFEQATERYPIEPPALLAYAAVAERQNHTEPARRALIRYTALVASDPESVAHAARIAILSLRLNDLDTAAVWVKRGMERDPQNAILAVLEDRIRARAAHR